MFSNGIIELLLTFFDIFINLFQLFQMISIEFSSFYEKNQFALIFECFQMKLLNFFWHFVGYLWPTVEFDLGIGVARVGHDVDAPAQPLHLQSVVGDRLPLAVLAPRAHQQRKARFKVARHRLQSQKKKINFFKMNQWI